MESTMVDGGPSSHGSSSSSSSRSHSKKPHGGDCETKDSTMHDPSNYRRERRSGREAKEERSCHDNINSSRRHQRSHSAGSSCHRRHSRLSNKQSKDGSNNISHSSHHGKSSRTTSKSRSRSPHHLRQRKQESRRNRDKKDEPHKEANGVVGGDKAKIKSSDNKSRTGDTSKNPRSRPRSNSPHYLSRSSHHKKESGRSHNHRTRHQRRGSTPTTTSSAEATIVGRLHESEPSVVGPPAAPTSPCPPSPTRRSQRTRRHTLSSSISSIASTSITSTPTSSRRRRKLKLPEDHDPKSPTISSRSSLSTKSSSSSSAMKYLNNSITKTPRSTPDTTRHQKSRNKKKSITSITDLVAPNITNDSVSSFEQDITKTPSTRTKSPAPRIVLSATPSTTATTMTRSSNIDGGNSSSAILSIRDFIANLPLDIDDDNETNNDNNNDKDGRKRVVAANGGRSRDKNQVDDNSIELFQVLNNQSSTTDSISKNNNSMSSCGSGGFANEGKKTTASLPIPVDTASGNKSDGKSKKLHRSSVKSRGRREDRSATGMAASFASFETPRSTGTVAATAHSGAVSLNQSTPSVVGDSEALKSSDKSNFMDDDADVEAFHNSWPEMENALGSTEFKANRLHSVLQKNRDNVDGDVLDVVSLFSEPFPENSPKSGARKAPFAGNPKNQISGQDHNNMKEETLHVGGGVVVTAVPLNDLSEEADRTGVPAWMARRSHPQPYNDFYANSSHPAVAPNSSNHDEASGIGRPDSILPSASQTCRPKSSIAPKDISDLPSMMTGVKGGRGHRGSRHKPPLQSKSESGQRILKASKPFRSDDSQKKKLPRSSSSSLASFLTISKGTNDKNGREKMVAGEDATWGDNITLASTVYSMSGAPRLVHRSSSATSSEEGQPKTKQKIDERRMDRPPLQSDGSDKVSSNHTASTVTTRSSLQLAD